MPTYIYTPFIYYFFPKELEWMKNPRKHWSERVHACSQHNTSLLHCRPLTLQLLVLNYNFYI